MRCAAPPRPLYGRSAAAPPACAACRGAEALGYPRRRPPARARAECIAVLRYTVELNTPHSRHPAVPNRISHRICVQRRPNTPIAASDGHPFPRSAHSRFHPALQFDMSRNAMPETTKPSPGWEMASLLRMILALYAGKGACRICSERARILCE
jgi:UDP:flavonoid glycosyltransferase YjiC (YdhE family)